MLNNAAVHMELSTAAYESGNFDQAIAEINQVIRLFEQQPPGPEWNQQLGLAYCARGQTRQKKEDYSEAIADYNRALAILPSTPETVDDVATCYMERGACYMMKGHADNNPRLLEAAETDLNYAVNLYEGRGTDAPGGIYAKRGLFYFFTGRQKQAEGDLKRAQQAGVTIPAEVWAEVNAEQYADLAKGVDAGVPFRNRGCLGPLALIFVMSVVLFVPLGVSNFSVTVSYGLIALGIGWFFYEVIRSVRLSSHSKQDKLATFSVQYPGFEEYYRTRQRNSQAQARARLAKGALLAGAIGAATVGTMAKQSYDESFGRK